MLGACQYIPGTDANKIGQAKEIAARDLIDPSSAQFRDLKVNGDMVCGEINGKNRMGAYVGFKRFFARVNSKTSMIDPEFDLADKLSADSLCSSMRSNIYSYSSSASACQRASEKALEQIAQEVFDSSWATDCEGKPSAIVSEPAPASKAPEQTESSIDANMMLEYEPTGKLVDVEGDVIEEEPAPSTSTSSEQPASDKVDQAWLDEVLGRQPKTAEDPLVPRNEEAGEAPAE
jgi:hypothetical protein